MKKVKKTVTTREVITIELEEEEIKDALREHFDMVDAEVSFNISSGGAYITSAELRIEKVSMKDASDEPT